MNPSLIKGKHNTKMPNQVLWSVLEKQDPRAEITLNHVQTLHAVWGTNKFFIREHLTI